MLKSPTKSTRLLSSLTLPGAAASMSPIVLGGPLSDFEFVRSKKTQQSTRLNYSANYPSEKLIRSPSRLFCNKLKLNPLSPPAQKMIHNLLLSNLLEPLTFPLSDLYDAAKDYKALIATLKLRDTEDEKVLNQILSEVPNDFHVMQILDHLLQQERVILAR